MSACIEEHEEKSCFYCDGIVPKGWGEREEDHFPVPTAAGGVRIVVACYSCRHMKDRIRLYEWPIEWVGRVLADLPKFGGTISVFLLKAAQAILRAQHKEAFEWMALAEECGIPCHDWPVDWQASVISAFPNLSRETRIFLAKVMALTNLAAVKTVQPLLPPLDRMTLATAVITRTFRSVESKGHQLFLPGFDLQCGTGTVN